MYLVLLAGSRRVHKEVKSDITWFNPVSMRYEKHNATYVKTEFDPVSKQLKAIPVIEKKSFYEHSWGDIQKFLSSYKDKISIIQKDIKSRVILEIDDNLFVDVSKKLKDMDIVFDELDSNELEAHL